jgi:transposase-like protein
MGLRFRSELEKEAIVADYLSGGGSFRYLGKKYDVAFKNIQRWVMEYKGIKRTKIKKEPSADCSLSPSSPPLPTELKQLQEELRKAKLHNELLNAMIDIAEKDLKIDIRKKSGTKR